MKGDFTVEILLTVLQVIACIGLIATVLLQSGKSAGLSGAITGGAETFFGKKGMDDKFATYRTVGGMLYFDFARRYVQMGDITYRRTFVPFMGLGADRLGTSRLVAIAKEQTT